MYAKILVRRLLLAGLATATLAAAGCSTTGHSNTGHSGMPGMASSAPAGANYNSADVTFAQAMIPHHEQAVRMSELAATRAADPQVQQLATQIKTAQGPEIETMKGWLAAWGRPTADPMGGMHGAMPGMMTDQQMSGLEGLSGAAFDREYTRMMVAHHQGAVAMAKTEQAQGGNADAKALAAKIEKDQTAEIAVLQQVLDRL
ncbi:DUF305 domain-containing protein [Catellatospora tritici]|uniref:DUF305 domain-containing protein n=1 Tax=Catellatospora tritici TaxID=2851566 RepID=UPI001C2D17DC|nr:DUF305 domain-containing protein [Catellatospora tritici]MBV1854300.1 DUF305 domain-containing protein [Catellatospora tritici]